MKKSMRRRKLALGVVTFNNSDKQLSRFYRSVNDAAMHAAVELEVHVCANDSRKSDVFDDVASYSLQPNIGFGAAHNILLDRSIRRDVEGYVCINPDGFLHYDAFRSMLDVLDEAGGRSLVEAIQIPVQHPKPYDPVSLETPWVSGACVLIPSIIYRHIGGFDEKLFMYCEDVDLSWRAKLAGFSLKTDPTAWFYHDVTSRGRNIITERQLLQSARYLGLKYSSPSFTDWVDEIFLANKLVRDRRAIQQVEPTQKFVCEPAICEFRNGLSFSFPRW